MIEFAEQTAREMEIVFVQAPERLAAGHELAPVIRWLHGAIDMHRCALGLLPRCPPSQQQRDTRAKYVQANTQLLDMARLWAERTLTRRILEGWKTASINSRLQTADGTAQTVQPTLQLLPGDPSIFDLDHASLLTPLQTMGSFASDSMYDSASDSRSWSNPELHIHIILDGSHGDLRLHARVASPSHTCKRPSDVSDVLSEQEEEWLVAKQKRESSLPRLTPTVNAPAQYDEKAETCDRCVLC
eukprot:TRINITY_DN18160_c0_g1_i2.p1 TRINITY_DN18160_c0_g1~~TRINITY_DN18160_c0_g1_i2.p1  ORF type:complete len:244 (+),score=20.58 TRINITY_DN18160_c0_g1_i2:835-1566(+)